jgi:hypothetical protein
MKVFRPRDRYLILAIVLISFAVIIVIVERLFDNAGSDDLRVFAYRATFYLALALNIVISCLGMLGPYRFAWLAYLVFSLAIYFMFYGETPIIALFYWWDMRACC